MADILITVESQAPRATKELKDLANQSLETLRATKQLSSQGGLDKHLASIERQISRVNANMSNYSRFTSQAANSSSRFGVVTQQAGYQIGDFLVQIQSGTNWMVAFGQQATQLVGVLPMMTGAFGLSTGALVGISAGLGIAIPLVTAIGAAFMRTGGEAKDTTNIFKEAEQALSDLAEVSSDFERSSANSFRVAKQEATSFLEVIRSIRSEKLNTILDEALSSAGISKAIQELDAAVDSIFSAEAMSGVGRSFSDIRDEIYATTKIFGLTANEAARLDSILKSVGGTTKEEVAASFFVAVERIKEANLLSDQTKTLIDQIASELGLVEQAYEDIDTVASSIYSTLTNMSLVDLSKPFSGAMPALQGFLDKVLKMADAYAEFGLYVIPGTATPRGKAPAGGLDSVVRATMAEYTTDPFGKIASGAGGIQKSLKEVEKAARGAGKAIVEELTDAEKAAKELADTLDGYVINAVESLGGAWGDFVVSGFTDFKSFASNVLDSFKNMLANMIALAAKNQIMLNLGIAGGGVGGVVGGLTGPGGPFGGVGALAGKIGGFGGNLITGAMGFIKSIGAGAKAVGSYLSTAVAGVKSLATLGTALGAVALPIAAVVAAVSFFKKKVKVLDTGLNVAVEGVNAFVTSFETKETKRFFGLSKKVKTSEGNVGADVSDPIQNAVTQMQQAVVDAAAAFGYGAESFKNFTYEFRLSLKDLTEEQQMQKINEELTKMGDAFASMIPEITSMNELLEAAQQRYDLTTRLLQLQGKEEELIARQREAELAAVHPLNRELLLRIHTLEEEQRVAEKARLAAEQAVAAAQQAVAAAQQTADAATRAVQTAFTALTASIRASVDTIVSNLRNKLTLANEAVTRSRDIFSQLQSALSSRSLSGGVEASKFRQSSALSFLSKGNFQDEEALKGALDVVAQPTEDLYGSFEEYARNFFKTSAVIDKAKSVAERQLSQDEKQVSLLEDQIDAAEAQYQIMVDQYGALLGINNSVLSVSQAIANLVKALAAQTAAQQAADSAVASEVAAVSAMGKVTEGVKKNADAASIIDQLYASGGYGKQNQEVYANWVKYAETQGTQKAIQEWSRLGNIGTVKGYANGGMHSGGVRLVGEDGPELEFTGPSRISSNKQSASMFRDPELRDAIMSLKSEVSGLRSDQLQIQMDISKYTKRSYDIERKWDVEGLPATRI